MRVALAATICAFGATACWNVVAPSSFRVLQADDLDFDADGVVRPYRLDDAKIAEVESAVRSVRERLGVPSFSVGVVVGNELAYRKAFGYRRLSDEQPATPDTLYHVGSVSKPITAALLMLLVERGEIGLDDSVADHLPDSVLMPTWDGRRPELTVRHLATHSSGLPMSPPNRQNVGHGVWPNPGQAKPYTVEELYDALGSTALLSAPGEKCRYSNYGYGLLGHVIERATGEPLESLMKSRLFEPLGMDGTTVTLSDDLASRFATHYWHDDWNRPRIDRARTRFGEVFAHGGVISSVDDLARFVSSQFSGDAGVLLAQVAAQMRTPAQSSLGGPMLLDRDGVSMQMGVGWRVQFPGQHGGIVNHSGEMDGHSAYVAFAPEARVGVIVLANLGGSRFRHTNPTAAVQLGVLLKERVLYEALGWTPKHDMEGQDESRAAGESPQSGS